MVECHDTRVLTATSPQQTGVVICVCVKRGCLFARKVVEEQNTAAIQDLCRALQQHRLLESPHLHVRSLALEVRA